MFLAATLFYDVLRQFGELNAEVRPPSRRRRLR
jgi:hypothetical protein